MYPRTMLQGGVKRTTYAAVFAPWLGAGRRVLAAGVVGAAATRCLEAPLVIALTASGDFRFAEIDRQDRYCTFCDSGAVGEEKRWNATPFAKGLADSDLLSSETSMNANQPE